VIAPLKGRGFLACQLTQTATKAIWTWKDSWALQNAMAT